MASTAQKNTIYSLILLVVVLSVYLWRSKTDSQESEESEVPSSGQISFSGQTMGTTYSLTYLSETGKNLQSSVDSLLLVFNMSLSTYIPDSEISKFNRMDTLAFTLPYLPQVLNASRTVYENTDGAFDPTVGPLVNVWGFGPGGPELKDSADIEVLLRLVGFDKINFDTKEIRKTVPGVYLDFSAIAKGQGVDMIAEFLTTKGIKNFLIEIGGELVASGVNEKGELWKVGINRPDETASASDLYSIIALENRGMATSGNYRNYYIKGSVKISHTINPATGYPVNHSLLSATVLAKDCMTADAYATALMVMGVERAIQLDSALSEIEVFLIYGDGKGGYATFASESLKPYLSFIQE
jgi:thiamine biosynthesis lipoprotein